MESRYISTGSDTETIALEYRIEQLHEAIKIELVWVETLTEKPSLAYIVYTRKGERGFFSSIYTYNGIEGTKKGGG